MQDDLNMSLKKATYPPRHQSVSAQIWPAWISFRAYVFHRITYFKVLECVFEYLSVTSELLLVQNLAQDFTK